MNLHYYWHKLKTSNVILNIRMFVYKWLKNSIFIEFIMKLNSGLLLHSKVQLKSRIYYRINIFPNIMKIKARISKFIIAFIQLLYMT